VTNVFAILQSETNTIIFSLGVKFFTRDLLATSVIVRDLRSSDTVKLMSMTTALFLAQFQAQ